MRILNNRGFSLIEILVAASVVTIALLATVAMVRESHKMTYLDRHRRAARAIIDKAIETSPYNQANYANIASIAATSVTIDPRASLLGSFVITVVEDKATYAPVWIKKISFGVSWTEPGTGAMTVQIDKWISP